jgi:alcohol dehydrogenase
MLAALLTAQFYSPAEIIMDDFDDHRLDVAERFGATAVVNAGQGDAANAYETFGHAANTGALKIIVDV